MENSIELEAIQAEFSNHQWPVPGINVDICYHHARGWSFRTYNDQLRRLSQEEKMRFVTSAYVLMRKIRDKHKVNVFLERHDHMPVL